LIDKYHISLDYRLRRHEAFQKAYELSQGIEYILNQTENFGFFKKRKFRKEFKKNMKKRIGTMEDILESYNCAYERYLL